MNIQLDTAQTLWPKYTDCKNEGEGVAKHLSSKSWCPVACCKAFVLSLLNTIKTRAVISFIRIQTRAVHSVRVNDSNSEISCSKSSSSLDKEMLMLSLMPFFDCLILIATGSKNQPRKFLDFLRIRCFCSIVLTRIQRSHPTPLIATLCFRHNFHLY